MYPLTTCNSAQHNSFLHRVECSSATLGHCLHAGSEQTPPQNSPETFSTPSHSNRTTVLQPQTCRKKALIPYLAPATAPELSMGTQCTQRRGVPPVAFSSTYMSPENEICHFIYSSVSWHLCFTLIMEWVWTSGLHFRAWQYEICLSLSSPVMK